MRFCGCLFVLFCFCLFVCLFCLFLWGGGAFSIRQDQETAGGGGGGGEQNCQQRRAGIEQAYLKITQYKYAFKPTYKLNSWNTSVFFICIHYLFNAFIYLLICIN